MRYGLIPTNPFVALFIIHFPSVDKKNNPKLALRAALRISSITTSSRLPGDNVVFRRENGAGANFSMNGTAAGLGDRYFQVHIPV